MLLSRQISPLQNVSFIYFSILFCRRQQTHVEVFACLLNHHHYHHAVPLVRISLTLSRHFSLSFIASCRSSGLPPVSPQSCCMYVQADRPAFARPYVGIHRSTSLMSSSLLLQQYPTCLVHLTCIIFAMGGRWPYNCGVLPPGLVQHCSQHCLQHCLIRTPKTMELIFESKLCSKSLSLSLNFELSKLLISIESVGSYFSAQI